MEVHSKDYTFILEKSPQETWDQFYLRRCLICNCLDRQPHLIDSLDTVIEMSFFWISYKYVNCHLKRNILKTVNAFF